MIWLSSDHHCFHTNILAYCSRPYTDLTHMHEGLIEAHNKVVSSTDTVYILGDFCMSTRPAQAIEMWNKFNGIKYLIPGNHDYPWIERYRNNGMSGITILDSIQIIKYQGKKITLCHYPIENWIRSYDPSSFHFHGHSHGNSTPRHRRWDVGVDNNDFKPISIDEALLKAETNYEEYEY